MPYEITKLFNYAQINIRNPPSASPEQMKKFVEALKSQNYYLLVQGAESILKLK